jgi:hypothetical protein
MSKSIDIKIVIDPSLAKYFEEGMSEKHIDFSTAEEITTFLTMVLNDSLYPVASSKTGEQEIHLTYRPRAFADPIF